jgi:hypothetical protein
MIESARAQCVDAIFGSRANRSRAVRADTWKRAIRSLGEPQRPVVVAMITVRMMQPSIHEVINMVTMRHRFVPAGRAMLVRAARLRRALDGVGGADVDRMLVDMILVHVMEMAIVQIVHMTIMANRRVAAVRAMLMGVVGMVLLGAGGHGVLSFWFVIRLGSAVIAFGGMLHGAFHQSQNVAVE